MRYIIHVIDDSSQHEKQENGKYGIIQGISLEESVCDILRSDVFYMVEAENAIDAVTILANTIKVKKQNGEEIFLAESFTETHKRIATTDFSNDSLSSIDDTNSKVITASYSESYMASCQVMMEKNGEKWVELHKVYFYVLEENKIIEV